MRILAIDPGLAHLGVAILEKLNNEEIILIFTVEIKTKAGEELHCRLYHIYKELTEIIEMYKPHMLAVEESFVNINNNSSLKLGMVIGIVLMLGEKYQLIVKTITPTAMKLALTGYGHASKEDVYFLIKQILVIPENLSHHIYDAIAIGFLFL